MVRSLHFQTDPGVESRCRGWGQISGLIQREGGGGWTLKRTDQMCADTRNLTRSMHIQRTMSNLSKPVQGKCPFSFSRQIAHPLLPASLPPSLLTGHERRFLLLGGAALASRHLGGRRAVARGPVSVARLLTGSRTARLRLQRDDVKSIDTRAKRFLGNAFPNFGRKRVIPPPPHPHPHNVLYSKR